MHTKEGFLAEVAAHIEEEKAASRFNSVVAELWFQKGIEMMLFFKDLLDKSTSEVLNIHNYARKVVGKNITIFETREIAEAVLRADMNPARIDVGRLASEWCEEKDNYTDVDAFVADKMAEFIGPDNREDVEPKDVILYGFGRIGRLLARELMAKEGRGEQLRLRAIVTRSNDEMSIQKRASLLRMDSVHGHFPGTVIEDYENKALILNGHKVHMIASNAPEDIDYTLYGIENALVLDNTGAFRDEEGLGRHLKAKGVSKVLLTAPGKGVPNIVHGVNHKEFSPDSLDIFSAASCTTNAITPVLKVIEDELGVVKGHIETVHAYTNDQNLVDNMHKKYRRGRAAALNMVITETGAGKAVTKAVPSFEGKLTSNAIRVPTPNGSLAILNLTVAKETSQEEVNQIMRRYALHSDLVEQIEYSMVEELVSTDIVGRSAPAIFDSQATIVSNDGKSLVLYVWYDNEYGYSCQVIRLAKYISKVRRLRYY
jgi:glyceraldehyde 3-phosphate dehydrogenase